MIQKRPPSKSRLLMRMALLWGVPMYVFMGGMLWKFDALTVATAFGLAIICALCSFGFGAGMVAYMDKKFGPFKD
jgi:hypothetical protein